MSNRTLLNWLGGFIVGASLALAATSAADDLYLFTGREWLWDDPAAVSGMIQGRFLYVPKLPDPRPPRFRDSLPTLQVNPYYDLLGRMAPWSGIGDPCGGR